MGELRTVFCRECSQRYLSSETSRCTLCGATDSLESPQAPAPAAATPPAPVQEMVDPELLKKELGPGREMAVTPGLSVAERDALAAAPTGDAVYVYPPTPAGVPANLTAPSPSYRSRVVLVLMGLIAFVTLYVGLVVGSAYLSYASFSALGSNDTRSTSTYYSYGRRSHRTGDEPTFWYVIGGILSGALCLFLVKGFFKFRRSDKEQRVAITEAEQPVLFAFIRQVCKDTREPFPHRVYLSPEVNAAVFYHESFLSLVVPTPKNLLIGLGLVNQSNLSEFKAVLAHEFGHFSQNSMKLGRYVYVANGIIADLVFGRDWLDDAVSALGRVDIRIAIFAWGFMGVLWVVRQALRGLFNGINFANSALMRQMEFNADLVAVSVTGSDALVHGLVRMDLAGDALGLACHELNAAADHKLFTRDLFYHQTCAAAYLRAQPGCERRGEPLGEPPPLPADPNERTQIFTPEDHKVPLMWATHPTNFDRETNVKRHYVRSVIDERRPWLLFANAAAVREKVTRHFYEVVRGVGELELAAPQVVQSFIDDERAETTYDPRYHGAYDDRWLWMKDVAEELAAAATPDADGKGLTEAHAQLHGDELKTRMASYQEHRQESNLLRGLVHGEFKLTGKDFPFREGRYRASDAQRLLHQVEQELEADNAWLADMDRRVLRVHHAMATEVGPAARAELESRYRFHLTLQTILLSLGSQLDEVQGTLSPLIGRREVSQAEFDSAQRCVERARFLVVRHLESAANLHLPELKNVAAGTPLGPFLLDETRTRELRTRAPSLSGDWLNDFMGKLNEIIGRLRRIHFKSLGGILVLQETISARWLAMRAAPEVVPATTTRADDAANAQ